MIFIIAQIFGFLAITFWTLSIQNKKKSNVLLFQIYSSLCYAVQFFLLKGYSAFAIDLISVLRLCVFYQRENKNGYIEKHWLYIFLFITVLSSIFTYDGLISLIPVVIGVFYTISTWVKSTKVLRIFYIICAVLWMGYNYIYGALIAVVGNIIEIVSGIISMIRYDRKGVKK